MNHLKLTISASQTYDDTVKDFVLNRMDVTWERDGEEKNMTDEEYALALQTMIEGITTLLVRQNKNTRSEYDRLCFELRSAIKLSQEKELRKIYINP